MKLRDVIPAHLRASRGAGLWAALSGPSENCYVQCGEGSLPAREGFARVYVLPPTNRSDLYRAEYVAVDTLLGQLIVDAIADDSAWPALLDVLLDDPRLRDTVQGVLHG